MSRILSEAALFSQQLRAAAKEGPSCELSAVRIPRSWGKSTSVPNGAGDLGDTSQLYYSDSIFWIPNSGYGSGYLFTGWLLQKLCSFNVKEIKQIRQRWEKDYKCCFGLWVGNEKYLSLAFPSLSSPCSVSVPLLCHILCVIHIH